ncbi:beta-methylgalactoside transporter, partial [Acinetobacter baumannii]|nr:beta-methylgalactoside transporter [Acinetobacter baumannii]
IFVGLFTENFFTLRNFKNLLINVSPRFIIACGVSGCLITTGTDLSAGRMVGLSACLSAMLLQDVNYAGRMLPWLPDIP